MLQVARDNLTATQLIALHLENAATNRYFKSVEDFLAAMIDRELEMIKLFGIKIVKDSNSNDPS